MKPEVINPTLDGIGDVRRWFSALIDAGILFHPEESFFHIVEFDSGAATFTPSEAACMDKAMARVYDIVADPNDIALEVTLEALKMRQEES